MEPHVNAASFLVGKLDSMTLDDPLEIWCPKQVLLCGFLTIAHEYSHSSSVHELILSALRQGLWVDIE
jgi:hypothetical protein